MLGKYPIFAVLCASLMTSQAFAWSWKDATATAQKTNPALQANKASADGFYLRYENAKSLRYPRLSIQGGLQNFQNQTQELQYRAVIGPRLQWLLYQGGKVSRGIEQADYLRQQADTNVRAVSVATNARLREAFAQAVYARNFLDLAHRIEKQRQDNVKITEIRYKSGLEYKWVFLSSTAKWKKAQLDATRAEMNKRTALADLEKLLGTLPIQSVEEISDQDFYADTTDYIEEQVSEKWKENPKYLTQFYRVQESEAGIGVSKADRYPTLAFQGDFFAASVEENDLFPFWTTNLFLSVPVFEAGRINRNISIAKQLWTQRKFELQQSEQEIKADLKTHYLNYYVSKQQVEISRLSVEAAKDRAKVVSNQYRSGLANFLEWESSQDVWVNSEIELLNSIRTYQLSRAKLEESMGVEL